MIKTNQPRLVQFALQGNIIPPLAFGWEVDRQGQGSFLPSVGGITYNVRVGDSVYGFEGDHLEPGISCIAGGFSDKRTSNPNLSFNVYSCIGNEAVILTGKAKDKRGKVTGHHGGVEHVILDFSDEVINTLTYDDKILIKAVGQGLQLPDYPDIHVFSLDPDLFQKIPIKEKKKSLAVPVAAVVPAELMGSGMGHNDTFKGDYDIQSSDPAKLKQYGLDKLRFGDLVAIIDHQSRYGWSFRQGAVSIAVVSHGDSVLAGHGPGVQTIMSSAEGLIEPVIDKNANIGHYLGIGRFTRKKKA